MCEDTDEPPEPEPTYLCEACGQMIPETFWPSHELGVDRRRPDCPAQDIGALARRDARPSHGRGLHGEEW